MYSIDCLNRQAFKLLSSRFHSDPPIYSTYLTIFSSFSKSHDIYDQHSLLYIAKCLEDQFFYFGLRGFDYGIPRFSVYIPFEYHSLGHGTQSIIFSASILSFLGLTSLQLSVHCSNTNALRLYQKVGFQVINSSNHDFVIMESSVTTLMALPSKAFNLTCDAFAILKAFRSRIVTQSQVFK